MKKIKLFFELLIGAVRFRTAVWKAELLHNNTGKRYYVIPSPAKFGKLLVINSDDRKMLQRRKVMRKNVDHLFLMENALYYTDAGGKCNDTKMEKRSAREQEQMWLDHIRNHSKQK